MALALLHHDLITVPRGRRVDGIYWLRAYADGASCIAVATEVPGNPGQSVINASEAIVLDIEHRLGVDPAWLTVYAVMPSGATGESVPSAWRVHLRPELRWDKVAIPDIEAAVGQRLATLPPHDDLLRRVVALGGDLEDETYEAVFETIAVGDLPPPHLPFRCAFAGRFEEMKDELGKRDLTEVEVVALGDRFLASLTTEDRKACHFHGADWRSIAEESVRIVERSSARTPDALAASAWACPLPMVERRWLESLFRQPVVVHDHSYGDGQHRGCALRFSGASHAVVVRDFVARRGGLGVWTYTGDG